ncbi:hypothetical protein [Kribbella monticola]|uniref:hypothetical protein n=1 Tax=Kribbella monticola TaxID=2185285 RepID=UPI000DD4A60F|nr:hypothetical protein [Kribbella monticola]
MRLRKLVVLTSAALTLLGGVAAVPATAVTETSQTTMQPASVANGAISRQEMLLRSASWIRDQVPYSQDNASPHVNEYGSYRRDCSGFLSMAWHLGSSLTTASLPSVMHAITYDDLQPGDALHRTSGGVNHIALFVRWADVARTRPTVREEYDYGHVAEERTWTNSYLKTFTPYRYNKVAGATASPGSWMGQDVAGRLISFAATADGSVQLAAQTAPAAQTWQSTVIEPPGSVAVDSRIATTLDSIGRAYYFAITPDGKLRAGYETTPGAAQWVSGTIEPTTDLDGVETVHLTGDPAASIDARGKLTYFARTTDGRLFHGWQDAPGSSLWHATIIRDSVTNQQLSITSRPVVAQDNLGRIAFLTRKADGNLLYGRQAAPGTGPWKTATIATSPLAGDPSVAVDVSGKLVYFARTVDGKLFHGWQTSAGADTWQSTTIQPTTDTDGVETVQLAGEPVISLDNGAKLTYFIRTTDGRLLHGWQQTPGSDPWHSTIIRDATTDQLPNLAADPAVYLDSAGKLVFVAVSTNATLIQGWQHAPGTGPWHLVPL